jgi:hypothetical protein
VPRVKRADWLVLLSDRTLAALGGADSLKEALGRAVPERIDVATYPVAHGLAVRVGAAPEPLNPAPNGVPAARRALARILRPVRLPAIDGPAGVPEDWVTDWLTVYDA